LLDFQGSMRAARRLAGSRGWESLLWWVWEKSLKKWKVAF